MLFKNLSLYRITEKLAIGQPELNEALQNRPFVPCGSQDWSRKGFVTPIDRTDELTLSIGNCHLMALKIQEKVLPAAAVAEALTEKVAEIEAKENRIIGRKERKQLKDQVTQELLPRALTKSKLIFGYLDLNQDLLIINSASASASEEYIGALRDALNSLPVIPMETNRPLSSTFSTWVLDKVPEGINLNGGCLMIDPESGAKVTVSEHDLTNEAFCNLLHEGHVIEKLSVRLPDEVTFTLTKDLRVSKMKFVDAALMAGRSEDNETTSDVARADFMILIGMVSRMLAMILAECGGEADRKISVKPSANEGEGDELDEMYPHAVKFVMDSQKATISGVQRELRIGYNRAARLLERMEVEGKIGPMGTDGVRPVITLSAA